MTSRPGCQCRRAAVLLVYTREEKDQDFVVLDGILGALASSPLRGSLEILFLLHSLTPTARPACRDTVLLRYVVVILENDHRGFSSHRAWQCTTLSTRFVCLRCCSRHTSLLDSRRCALPHKGLVRRTSVRRDCQVYRLSSGAGGADRELMAVQV